MPFCKSEVKEWVDGMASSSILVLHIMFESLVAGTNCWP